MDIFANDNSSLEYVNKHDSYGKYMMQTYSDQKQEIDEAESPTLRDV